MGGCGTTAAGGGRGGAGGAEVRSRGLVWVWVAGGDEGHDAGQEEEQEVVVVERENGEGWK